MSAIELRNVNKQFGTQVVLDNVSLVVHPGERVGLIGVNGAGKTTLFRIMCGMLDPDDGTVIRSRKAGIGLLAQEPDLMTERSLREEVASVFDELLEREQAIQSLSERIADASGRGENVDDLLATLDQMQHRFEAAGGHNFQIRLGEILGGLGFQESDREVKVGVLSGGQRCRAALAKLLLQDREILLLDEPTNHLDIDAVNWLEKFLSRHSGAVVVVSHDRYLLDRICTRMIEIERRKVTSYPGNYSNYAETKELRLLTEQRQFEKDSAFIKKEKAFIAKHIAGQRTAEAKGRRKRLERRLSNDEFVTDTQKHMKSVRINFNAEAPAPGAQIRCEDLTMGFGEKHLFSNVRFQIAPGERFAITGPNGTGKSTLLKIMVGELEPVSGRFELPAHLQFGYYAQEGHSLDTSRTVLEELRASRPEMSELEARSYAALFRFSGDDVFKKLANISGGEQSRVRLASLILSGPDVLMLDEPTNHLDIPSREALEDALLEFPGTIIVVSHDRYFLDRITDRLLFLRSDGSIVHQGNYSSFIKAQEQAVAQAQRANATPKKPARKPAKPATKGSGPSPYDRLSVEELEQIVIEKETLLAEIHEEFGLPDVYKDPERLENLRERQALIESELAEVDRAWQERADSQS